MSSRVHRNDHSFATLFSLRRFPEGGEELPEDLSRDRPFNSLKASSGRSSGLFMIWSKCHKTFWSMPCRSLSMNGDVMDLNMFTVCIVSYEVYMHHECMENVAYIFVVERPVSYQLALNWHTSLAIAKQSSPLHLTTLWIQNFTAYVSSVHTRSAIKPTPFLLPMYTFFHWSGSAIKQDFKERHDAPIYLIPDANITPSGHIFHMSYILTIYHRLRCSRHACPWHWKH